MEKTQIYLSPAVLHQDPKLNKYFWRLWKWKVASKQVISNWLQLPIDEIDFQYK